MPPTAPRIHNSSQGHGPTAPTPRLLLYILGAMVVSLSVLYRTSLHSNDYLDRILSQSADELALAPVFFGKPTDSSIATTTTTADDTLDDETDSDLGSNVGMDPLSNHKDSRMDTSPAWPEPRLANHNSTAALSSMVVLVMSGRNHFRKRAVIRETWGNQNNANDSLVHSVYFIIGQECPIPPSQRSSDLQCQAQQHTTGGPVVDDPVYTQQLQDEQESLRKEQQQYHDLLLVSRPESYSMLPFKLKEAYSFALDQHPDATWFVKADDDMMIQLDELHQDLQHKFNNNNMNTQHTPVVFGHIMKRAPVHRNGKWKEDKYRHSWYPHFPLGSWGHVVSRPVAEFVAEHKDQLVEYQGEDTSLGIWLHESTSPALRHQEILWVDMSPKHYTNRGQCHSRFWIAGHDFTAITMRRCFAKLQSSKTESSNIARAGTVGPAGRQDGHESGAAAVASWDPPNSGAANPIVQEESNTMSTLGDPNPNEWMPPRTTNATSIVVVMTARAHFEKRTAIRKSWADGHDNVYFVLGEPCRVPKHKRRHELTCEERTAPLPKAIQELVDQNQQKQSDEEYQREIESIQQRLRKEQEEYRDMIYTTRPESYRGLVHKLKEAYSWAVTNTNADWIIKADDDTFVRVGSVAKLLERFSPTNPTVVGRIIRHAPVHKTGKWADVDYPHERYPPWAQGSCGHVVSRSVAQYVHEHKDSLPEYQGEDTTMGIWLHESPIRSTVVWRDSGAFVNEGDCFNTSFVIVGHGIGSARMRQCYQAQDEVM